MAAVKYKFDTSEQSNTAFQEIKDQLSTKKFDYLISGKEDHMLCEIRQGFDTIGSIKFYRATPGDTTQPGCIEVDSGTSRYKVRLDDMVAVAVQKHGGKEEKVIDGPK